MKRQLWGFLCPWTSEIFQKLKRESVHLAPSLYGEIYKYQEITAFLGSWVAPISGVPEAQGMGNPAHQLVPSHKEKPKSLFWGSVGEEVVSKPRWGIPSVSTPQHPVRGGIWSEEWETRRISSPGSHCCIGTQAALIEPTLRAVERIMIPEAPRTRSISGWHPWFQLQIPTTEVAQPECTA